MADKRKDLPANSDANAKKSDNRYKQQEEYDNRGQDDLARESEARNERNTEQLRDSQMGDERMKPVSKSKAKLVGRRGRDQNPET